jgi:hypothetical protein
MRTRCEPGVCLDEGRIYLIVASGGEQAVERGPGDKAVAVTYKIATTGEEVGVLLSRLARTPLRSVDSGSAGDGMLLCSDDPRLQETQQ